MYAREAEVTLELINVHHSVFELHALECETGTDLELNDELHVLMRPSEQKVVSAEALSTIDLRYSNLGLNCRLAELRPGHPRGWPQMLKLCDKQAAEIGVEPQEVREDLGDGIFFV